MTLKESVKHEWSGDVDLSDGKVAKLHAEYKIRRKFIEDIDNNRQGRRLGMLDHLHKLDQDLKDDIYLPVSMLSASYFGLITSLLIIWEQPPSFFSIGLVESGHKSRVELQVIREIVEEDVDVIRANITRKITDLKVVLTNIVRGVYWYRHTVATHVLVIMISTESRSTKPYALPVQLHVHSLRELER